MRKRNLFCLLPVIAAFGIFFAGCDFFERGTGGSEANEPRIIKGSTVAGDPVEVEITRGTAKAALTPANGDKYVMKVNKAVVSRGTIRLDVRRIVFYPTGGGVAFSATYSGTSFDDAVITVHELPTPDGGVAPVLPPSPPTTEPTAVELAAQLAADLNALYGAGTAASSAAWVTLLKDISLTKTLTIPMGVTLAVPTTRTLTANASDKTGIADPDLKADGSDGPAGSGSYQITGPGTLDVGGTLVARNRTLRTAKTVLRQGAVYTLWYWTPSGFTNAGNLTSVLALDSGGTLEIAYAALPASQQVGILVDYYTFTLKGGAALNNEFKFADSSNTLKDNVVIENGAELRLALGTSSGQGGTITSGGTVSVKSGGKIVFNPQRPPKAPAIATGSMIILQGGTLEIYESPTGTMKVIGTTNEYMFQLGSGASIEMKPKSYTAPVNSPVSLFEYFFWGGTITTRPQTNGNIWMDVDYTIKNGATLSIPSGSKAFVIGGFDGYMIAGLAAGHADKRQYGFGTITVEAAGGLSVGGMLLLDGSGATLTVPSPITSSITGYSTNIGALDMTNAQGLVSNATVTGASLSPTIPPGTGTQVLTGKSWPPGP
jgi:hypothetical protein